VEGDEINDREVKFNEINGGNEKENEKWRKDGKIRQKSKIKEEQQGKGNRDQVKSNP
jgi:hypothetical protein